MLLASTPSSQLKGMLCYLPVFQIRSHTDEFSPIYLFFFRCGDILLAVNGRNTSGMMHACLARMLKELKGKITLTIVSWPGTFL